MPKKIPYHWQTFPTIDETVAFYEARRKENIAYYEREKARRVAQAAEETYDKAYHKAYLAANRGAYNARNAKRRAAKLQATPIWADHKAIKELYLEAAFLTKVIGEPYHVDHIVPLQSAIVCGLHWEANLRVIEGAKNNSKGNRHWPNMP
jgi:hypothetical protein